MKLSWDLIEDFLSEELNKTKHIMTFGTIGSLNVKHDIDLIITKNPNSSLKMFFEEIHNIFNTLDST